MATLHRSKDYHYFIVQGWPINGERSYATYQVSPAGEKVLCERLGFDEGSIIEERLFYALYLDGAIYHSNTNPYPSVADLPDSILGYNVPLPEELSLDDMLAKADRLSPLTLDAVFGLIEAECNSRGIRLPSGERTSPARLFITVRWLDARRRETYVD